MLGRLPKVEQPLAPTSAAGDSRAGKLDPGGRWRVLLQTRGKLQAGDAGLLGVFKDVIAIGTGRSRRGGPKG